MIDRRGGVVGGTMSELFVGRLYKQCGDWTESLNTVCILLTAPEAWQIAEFIEMGTLYSTFHLCLCHLSCSCVSARYRREMRWSGRRRLSGYTTRPSAPPQSVSRCVHACVQGLVGVRTYIASCGPSI